jgi:hypothetical protein
MRRDLRIPAILALIFVLLTLAACDGITATPSVTSNTSSDALLLPMATEPISPVPCDGCAQATLSALQTQEKSNTDAQAAATAAIVHANAQATLNAANATLNAVQTQDQNNANIVAAQLAATAQIIRANAEATLNSAVATQNAAQTQTQYDLQVKEMAGTQSAEAAIIQQNKNDLAAGTQTAVANIIATQTQSAIATSQVYADQARQRDEQRQGPITFLWMCCLPIFGVLLAGLILWSYWRWVKVQQGPRILEEPVEKLPAPVADYQQDNSSRYLESNIVDSRYHLTNPEDQVHGWVNEVKSKLASSDDKDEDDTDV